MKGREMIFIVNAFICLFGAVVITGYAALLQRTGDECAGGNATLCQRSLDQASGVAQTVPYLFSLGIILLGIGGTLIWYRRRKARS